MAATANANSGRALALARRKAMSTGGKAALGTQANTAASAAVASPPAVRGAPSSRAGSRPAATGSSARKASRERRRALSTRGKLAASSGDRTRGADDRSGSRKAAVQAARAEPVAKGDCGCGCGGGAERKEQPAGRQVTSTPGRPRARRKGRKVFAQSTAKAASLARRQAQSVRGKAGISAMGMSEAQTARAANPRLSGRELARAVREQRSQRGSSGQKKSAPSGRRRKAADAKPGAAQDAPWKVGASETSHGQTVTGTMVGRDPAVTGDEASTCRDVTGTEYLGADIFRDFCQAEPTKAPQRGARTTTSQGNKVTGNEVGRSGKVTGDEPGTCKRVTGSEYVSAEQAEAFCGTKAEAAANRVTSAETRKGKSVTGNNVGRTSAVTGNESGAGRELTGTQYTNVAAGGAPPKVGQSNTLRGGRVSGTMVGRREGMTGDEAGTCRNVTGDDYVGEEQFNDFCNSKPVPLDRKVGATRTLAGEEVTGSMTGRSSRVTGNEPGTCKAVTGTPYTGSEQYAAYCEPAAAEQAEARMRPDRRNFGAPMTGQQPAVGGRATGDARGACEAVSGTPYVGADQAAEACPAAAAEPGSPDFPQPLEGTPWSDFSVQSPAHAADQTAQRSQVTGLQYEQGQITGPFGMAGGKVTGTEEARFGAPGKATAPVRETATEIDGRIKSRISGEGQDAGAKITGDDWERGDRVTGTEGASATRRNTTLRGAPMAAMGARAVTPEEAPEPVSKVTGASGNTGNGAMVTYSGGARG